MRARTLAAALGLLAALACGSGEPPPSEGTPATRADAGDGLCEHGVLEAVCTKHDPALIPVFQAKGDWCQEHGFPLSFCPIHHPERGGRPVADVSSDGAPADGLRVRFRTRATAEIAGLAMATAELAADEGGLEAVARLTWGGREALVGAPADGVVDRVVADLGTKVSEGDPLAVVRSATASADRVGVEAARSGVAAAERTLARKRGLGEVVSRADLERAEQDLASARAGLRALEATAGYTLTSPIDGVVVRRDLTVGMAVSQGQLLFEVVDPSRLWAEVDVPEDDAHLVEVGQTASIALDGASGVVRSGTVDYVAPAIDPATRTALARVALDNADGALRANTYGTARVAVGGERDVVVVPSGAVQRARTVDVVFVRLAVDEYETRRVRVLRRQGERAHVAGVRPGEEVVSEGSFLLKTEILKDSIGAGCCDVE